MDISQTKFYLLHYYHDRTNFFSFIILLIQFVYQGPLNNLNNEDLMKLNETENNDIFCHSALLACEPHITFFPKTVVMDVTPALAETLDLMKKANATTVDSLSSSDELRSLTLGAIGSELQKISLNENLMLKVQDEALGNLREKVMRVDIAHRDGIVSFPLDEGEWKTDTQGDLLWTIRLEGKEYSSMAVHSIRDSTLSMSGSTLTIKDLLDYRQQGQGFIAATENDRVFGLVIPYYYGIKVVGAINWYEQDDDDLPKLLDSYREKLLASYSMSRARMLDVDPFPDTFRLELLYVTFSPDLIKDIFNVVGCDDLLITEGNEESTDSI